MSKKLIAIVVLTLTLLTSSRYVTPRDGREGYQAPTMQLSNASTSLSLQEFKGDYVIVTFWSSAEPTSRLANKQLEKLAEAKGFRHIAVNLDRSEGLFQQLVAADGLNPSLQFHIDPNEQEHLLASWRQRPGALSSFLIDPQGRIVRENPTAADF